MNLIHKKFGKAAAHAIVSCSLILISKCYQVDCGSCIFFGVLLVHSIIWFQASCAAQYIAGLRVLIFSVCFLIILKMACLNSRMLCPGDPFTVACAAISMCKWPYIFPCLCFFPNAMQENDALGLRRDLQHSKKSHPQPQLWKFNMPGTYWIQWNSIVQAQVTPNPWMSFDMFDCLRCVKLASVL